MTNEVKNSADAASASLTPEKVRTLEDLLAFLEGDVFTDAAKVEAPTFVLDLKAAIQRLRDDYAGGCCFCDDADFVSPLESARRLADHFRLESADKVRRICDALQAGHASDLEMLF